MWKGGMCWVFANFFRTDVYLVARYDIHAELELFWVGTYMFVEGFILEIGELQAFI
jgi:hypothetical protein